MNARDWGYDRRQAADGASAFKIKPANGGEFPVATPTTDRSETSARPPSGAGLEVWLVDLAACREALDAIELALPRLAPGELKKIAGSVTPASAVQRRASYIALRLLIERAFGPSWRGVPYELTGTGKPALPGLAQGDFNLAHVEGFALIGLSRGATIGIDLEPDRTPMVSDQRRALIESAAMALSNGAALPAGRQMRFLQAWVRLEAVAKADGRGIGRLLTGLGIIGPPDPGLSFNPAYAQAIRDRFHIADIAAGPGRVAAVALDGPIPDFRALSLPATASELSDLTKDRAWTD